VIFDGYRLADGFNMPLSCNYPEAYKEGETYVKNFTAMMSRDRIDSSSSTVFTSLYPGNGYFEDITVREYYMMLLDIKVGIALAATGL
jgi:hypothetical protein